MSTDMAEQASSQIKFHEGTLKIKELQKLSYTHILILNKFQEAP